MPISQSPFLDTVTTTTALVAQSLQSLLAALPSARKPAALANPSGIIRFTQIQIQADPAGAGTKYYIGSASGMTITASAGVVLLASQAWQPPTMGGNLYRADQIFLMADGNSANWYIEYITK